jgi:membrane-bound serine protease (ClpP class)
VTRLASAGAWPARPRLFAAICLLALVAASACAGDTPRGGVHVLTADGVINPVMANYLERGIEDGQRAGAEVVVVRLDTPGGLDSAMRDVVQAIEGASVPVVVWVAPPGARAASAGTFVVMSAHVAGMAPGTTIGAAHPVGGAGEDIEGDLGAKVENDAVAYLRSLAEMRGRNADWAERAVRDSIAASSSEAVRLAVVDLEAATLDALIAALDGRTVRLAGADEVRLETANLEVHERGMPLPERVLLVLSDPNIAFLLLSLGFLLILSEVFHPSGVAGVIGAVALIVAFASLGTLPVNWGAVALIGLAFALFVAEVFLPSAGLLGIGGMVALALGGLFLTNSANPEFEVSRLLAFGMPALIGAAFALLGLLVLRSRGRAISVGREALVGAEGVARSNLEPGGSEGYASVRGERWRARVEPGAARVETGQRVRVTAVDGLRLTVQPALDRAATPRAAPLPGPARMPRDEESERGGEAAQREGAT